MYKKHLKQSVFLFMSFMFCVALINVIIDPGEIYLKKIIADKKAQEFSFKLIHSERGVIQSGWNERLVKTELAKSAGDFECIVIGSSRVMQISSIRNTGGIQEQCSNLLNLGVSGGGIEDAAIFSYLILNNLKKPKHVFIGVDPWTLKFEMDSRYGAYNHLYENINELLSQKDTADSSSYSKKMLKNLFSGEYFYRSIRMLKKGNSDSIFKRIIQYPEETFSYAVGYDEAVTLADGSHIYAKAWIEDQQNKTIEIGGGDYKIDNEEYDSAALVYFKKLIELYQSRDVKVSLVMTPYHPNVFKVGQTQSVKHITVIDEVVREFTHENNLKYYGSFLPDNLGCQGTEFYDFMHPTNKCLDRIDFGA